MDQSPAAAASDSDSESEGRRSPSTGDGQPAPAQHHGPDLGDRERQDRFALSVTSSESEWEEFDSDEESDESSRPQQAMLEAGSDEETGEDVREAHMSSDEEPDVLCVRGNRRARSQSESSDEYVFDVVGESEDDLEDDVVDDNDDNPEGVLKARDGCEWTTTALACGTGRDLKPPESGILGCEEVTRPVDAFLLFLSEHLITDIVHYTNQEGRRQLGERFRDTDSVEIKGLMAFLMYLGVTKQTTHPPSFLYDSFMASGLARYSMTRFRFTQLLAYLRFDDLATRKARRADDVFAQFRSFWQEFTKNLQQHYTAGPFVAVGEQSIPFCGCCGFLQHVPIRRKPYGLKMFWAVDAETSYPLVVEPCLGKALGEDRDHRLDKNRILSLCEPFFNSGRNITCSCYITDKALSDALLARGLTCVGYVKKNARFVPASFKRTRGQPLHGSTFMFQGETTLVNYQIKRRQNVVVLSTMRHDDSLDPRGYKLVPNVIKFLASTTRALNETDGMVGDNSCKRRTRRWPTLMFYHCLDLAALAAWVIWKKKFPESLLTKRNCMGSFLLKVVSQLSNAQLQRCQKERWAARLLKYGVEVTVHHGDSSLEQEDGTEDSEEDVEEEDAEEEGKDAEEEVAQSDSDGPTPSKKFRFEWLPPSSPQD